MNGRRVARVRRSRRRGRPTSRMSCGPVPWSFLSARERVARTCYHGAARRVPRSLPAGPCQPGRVRDLAARPPEAHGKRKARRRTPLETRRPGAIIRPTFGQFGRSDFRAAVGQRRLGGHGVSAQRWGGDMAAARYRVVWMCLLLGVALAVAAASPALAQETRGSISGTVKDNSGGALPGVTVTATQKDDQPARRRPSRTRPGRSTCSSCSPASTRCPPN